MPTPDELVAAMDNHQITDDQGQLAEETTSQDSAPETNQPVEDDATAEKSAESEETAPAESKETENEPEMVETASDETGKRYVPEDRFKKVYGKMKEYERKLKSTPAAPIQPVAPRGPVDKTDAIEIELLRSTLPQFNPDSGEYSREIDELGYSLYESSKDAKGRYTMTRIEAGRKALSMARKLTSTVAKVQSEARTVKAQQSDQGITSRVLTREGTKPDPMKMSLEEKEKWLKDNNLW